MWNGTHTKAYILNSYEFVMWLTVFAFPGLYIGFHVLWVLWYDYPVARIGFIRNSYFMILMPCLFLPALTCLPPEYFLLDICIIVLTLLHHLVLLLHSPGEYHLTPLDSHVQVTEPGARRFPPLLIRVRSGSVDVQLTVQGYILPDPLCVSRVFPL